VIVQSVDGAKVAHPLFQGEEGGALPTSTLQFTLVEVPMREAAELNRRWHSMLPRTDLGNLLAGTSSVAYAAEFSGRYFAVAIWSQPIIRVVAKDGKTIELRRLAICAEAPKNTASRMLAVCRKLVKKKFPHMEKAVSYLAVDVHVGTIYRAAGWAPAGKITAARPQRKRGDRQRATGPLQTTSRKQRWEIMLPC
jgi:hypothetical protein